ncbi:MAG: hypothetical protein IKR28_04595, partial [Selenomonadaceae bacterium]|nr:hypothetical protein [Selenomonadaceae bacterium]
IRADAIVLDSRYQHDAKYYFDHIMTAENLSQALSDLNEKYDIIGMGAYFHEILDCAAIDMLERAYGLLSPGGQLIVPMKNFSSASSLKELIVSGEIAQWGCSIKTFKGLSLGGVIKELSQNELSKVCSRHIVLESDQTLCEKMCRSLSDIFSDYYSSSEFEALMKISVMWFMFDKPDVS